MKFFTVEFSPFCYMPSPLAIDTSSGSCSQTRPVLFRGTQINCYVVASITCEATSPLPEVSVVSAGRHVAASSGSLKQGITENFV
jgi:hypothetical protein